MRWWYTILWTCKFLKGRNRLLYLFQSLLFQKGFLSAHVCMSVRVYDTHVARWHSGKGRQKRTLQVVESYSLWEPFLCHPRWALVLCHPRWALALWKKSKRPQLLSHASSFSVCSSLMVVILPIPLVPFSLSYGVPLALIPVRIREKCFVLQHKCLSLPPPWKKVSPDIEYNVCSFSLFSSSVLQKTPYSLWLLKLWMWDQHVWVIVPSCVSCLVPFTICLSLSLS